MRIVSFLLLAFSMQVSAGSYAQKITLDIRNGSLTKVFEQIKKQSPVSIIWDEQLLEKALPVTIQVRQASLEEVLDLSFRDQPLVYKIIGNMVVVSKKESKPVASLPELLSVGKTANILVTGTVKDSNGAPVRGASIIVINDSKSKAVPGKAGTAPKLTGTMSDEKGEFRLELPALPVMLQISCMGFASQEIRVTSAGIINVTLQRESREMGEVVISTGMFNRRKESYTGAVTVVTAAELAQFGNRNLITSLRNIDPSFNIVENNTAGSNPNRLPDIQIRGNSSLPNVGQLKDESLAGLNTPLIILDGFQSSLEKLATINENEVETITILKDASATAIYGSRGANGVVVINTKAPKGGKLTISYRGDINLEAPDLTSYNLLGAREKLDLENKVGLYNHINADFDFALKRYYNYLLNEVNRGVNTDWLSQPVRTGIGHRHNLRVEGGDSKFRYSASAQLNDIQGVMKGSSQKIFNGTINLMYSFRNLRFNNNLMIAEVNGANSPYGNFDTYVKLNPYWRIHDDEGRLLKQLGDPGNTDYRSMWNVLTPNPLYDATVGAFDLSKSSNITNNTSLEWTMTPNLIFKGRFGIVKGTSGGDRFRPATHTAFINYAEADLFRKGDYYMSTARSFSYDGAVTLSYSKNFAGRHMLFAGFDANFRQTESNSNSFLAEGFPSSRINIMAMALQYGKGTKPSGSESFARAAGFTTNLSYSFNGRYFADMSYRLDGSSQFGTRNKFAPFWSAGFGWNLHNEPFMKHQQFVERLKLRGSLGIAGSQNFSSYQALSTFRYYTEDRYYNWNGAYLLALGNENLKWQQNRKYNLGMEAEFLKGRLKLTADIYTQTTDGLISAINLPATNGFPNYIENIGSIQNRGFELRATTFLLNNKQKGIYWSATVAMMHNRNKIIKISQALKDAQKEMENASGAAPNTLYREGNSTTTIWVVPSLGIDPSSGKEVYLGRDGMPTVKWDPKDIVAAGNTLPDVEGTISSMFRYKDFSVNIAVGFKTGGQQYNSTLIDKVENADYKFNVDERVYADRWQKPGDRAAFKGLLVTNTTNKTSRFVQDETTFTCRNINMQYNIRSPWLLRMMGLQSLSTAMNLSDVFYISTIRRERGTNYPFSRQYSLSISTTF